jgi:hypothetical protein
MILDAQLRATPSSGAVSPAMMVRLRVHMGLGYVMLSANRRPGTNGDHWLRITSGIANTELGFPA